MNSLWCWIRYLLLIFSWMFCWRFWSFVNPFELINFIIEFRVFFFVLPHIEDVPTLCQKLQGQKWLLWAQHFNGMRFSSSSSSCLVSWNGQFLQLESEQNNFCSFSVTYNIWGGGPSNEDLYSEIIFAVTLIYPQHILPCYNLMESIRIIPILIYYYQSLLSGNNQLMMIVVDIKTYY